MSGKATILSAVIILALVYATAAGAVINVPSDFGTIGEAITAASSGDTVQIANGVYYEHLMINKPLTLLGESRESTIVDGSSMGNVIEVTGSSVVIRRLTVQNAGPEEGVADGPKDSGIELYCAERCYLFGCSFRDNPAAGVSLGYARHCAVNNCLFEDNGTGVFFYSTYEDTLEENVSNSILFNQFTNQSACGLCFGHVSRYHRLNIIRGNTFNGDAFGIRTIMCAENLFTANTFIDNAESGMYYTECSGGGGDNVIFENGFFNSSADDNAEEFGWPETWWFNYALGRGNFYSDYTGEDSDSDGIGDTPYLIGGYVQAQDMYPLMAFEVTWGRCVGMRGNIDGDIGDTIDIADLVALVAFMFQDGSPSPCNVPNEDCPGHYYVEADVNGDGSCSPDIADLVYLVQYMFSGGPAPAACP